MVVDNGHGPKESLQKQFHVEQKQEQEQIEPNNVQPEQPEQEYLDENEIPF